VGRNKRESATKDNANGERIATWRAMYEGDNENDGHTKGDDDWNLASSINEASDDGAYYCGDETTFTDIGNTCSH
jgi:hypothetical protein